MKTLLKDIGWTLLAALFIVFITELLAIVIVDLACIARGLYL